MDNMMPRNEKELADMKAATAHVLMLRKQGTLKPTARERLPEPTERLNAKVREYVAYAAKVLNAPEPAELPDIIVANKYQEMLVHKAAATGQMFGAYFLGEKPIGDFLLLRDDVADEMEKGNPLPASVAVHELAHFVAMKSGLDKMGPYPDITARELGRRQAERHAYEVQGRWLWSQGISPRLFPAFDPVNLQAETGDAEFASLRWLDGFNDDPIVDWSEYWSGRTEVGDLWSDNPLLSVENYKSIMSGEKPRISLAEDGSVITTTPLFCQLSNLDAILIAEGGAANSREYIDAFQHLLDSGLVWQLQGWHGREAKSLIEQGHLTVHGDSYLSGDVVT